MNRYSAHPFRRTAIVSAFAAMSLVMAMIVPHFASAQEQEDFVSGSGRAKAQILHVGPRAAQLALAPSVGVSLADHIGTLGRGESLIFDYAALDTSINSGAPELKAEFPPLKVASTDANSEAGVRWEPKPTIVEDAAATQAPVGRSAISVGKVIDIPGVLEVDGARSRAFSGVYERTVDAESGETELVRVAGGTVSIAKIIIGGGALQLHDLRWEGAQVTDENDDEEIEKLGSFVVGRVIAEGETHDHVTHQDFEGILSAINEDVLSNIGITITSPTVDEDSGVVTVGPLGILVASDLLSDLGPVMQDVRGTPVPNDSDEEGEPEQEPLTKNIVDRCQEFEGSGEEEEGGEAENQGGGSTPGLFGRIDSGAAVLANHGGEHEEFDEFRSDGPQGQNQPVDFTPPEGEGSSNCGLPFLVADLAIAPYTGAGSLRLNFGGVLGFTEGETFEGFGIGEGGFDFGGNGGGDFEVSDSSASAPAPPAGIGSSGPSSTPSTPPPASGTPPSNGGQQAVGQGAPTVNVSNSPESALWALGLLGLAAAGAMAASDFRRLRSRRRSVTPIS